MFEQASDRLPLRSTFTATWCNSHYLQNSRICLRRNPDHCFVQKHGTVVEGDGDYIKLHTAEVGCCRSNGHGTPCCLDCVPVVLVHGLKMGRSTKIAVFFGFALRFPAVIFAVIRVAAMATMDYEDFTFSYIKPDIWGQVGMHYNVVAATTPCLRMFLRMEHKLHQYDLEGDGP